MKDFSPSNVGPGYEPESGLVAQLTLANFRAIAWRQRYILIGVLLLTLLAAFAYTLLQQPTYKASATLQVDTNQQSIVEGQELTDPYSAGNEYSRYLETIATVIRSRTLAQRVVEELDLTGDASFMALANSAPHAPGAPADASAVATAAAILQGGVEVTVPLENRIMTVSFTSRDPALAARIANGYTEAYLAFNIERSSNANEYAREYLEDQIGELRMQLQDAEQRANSFARTNRIIGQPIGVPSGEEGSASSGTAATLTASDLTNINQTYSEARAARIEAEQRWLAIANRSATQLPEVQQNSTYQSLTTELAQLNSQLANLRQRYRDDYPDIQELLARIRQVEQQIDRTAGQIKAGIRDAYEIARRQETAMARELSRVSDATLNEQDRRVAFGSIDREVAAYREQLDSLLERYNQISAASNIQASDATILDSATAPRAPFSPNLQSNMLVALIVGIGLAVALALLREFLDDRLRSIDDLERNVGIPALGQVPFVSGSVADAIDEQFSPLSEAYSSLRATLDYAISGVEHPIIMVTSSDAVEGKTTTATALARKFASIGKHVLLIDMDLRRPAVGKALGTPKPKGGIVDVLFGRLSMEQAVQAGPVPNLDLLLVGNIPPNPVEVISSGLVPEFLARQRQTYDLIIIDSSPVMGIADAPLLSRYVDGVVMVIEANNARFGKARAAIRRLRDSNARIIGAVLTKYRALEAGDGYNYQNSYYTYGDGTA